MNTGIIIIKCLSMMAGHEGQSLSTGVNLLPLSVSPVKSAYIHLYMLVNVSLGLKDTNNSHEII